MGGQAEAWASPGLALPHMAASQSPARAAPAKRARDSSALGCSERWFLRLCCKSRCPCISFALRLPSSTLVGALQRPALTVQAAPCTQDQCSDQMYDAVMILALGQCPGRGETWDIRQLYSPGQRSQGAETPSLQRCSDLVPPKWV